MIRLQPKSTLPHPLFPYTMLFRSIHHATLRINGKSSGRHAHCHAFDLDRVKWSFLQRAQIRVGQTRVASHDPAPRHGTTRKIFINASFTETIEARHGAFEALSINSDRAGQLRQRRSEEHTSALQSLMRISYAVFCLKKQ